MHIYIYLRHALSVASQQPSHDITQIIRVIRGNRELLGIYLDEALPSVVIELSPLGERNRSADTLKPYIYTHIV